MTTAINTHTIFGFHSTSEAKAIVEIEYVPHLPTASPLSSLSKHVWIKTYCHK